MAFEYVPHGGPIVTREAAKAAGARRYFTGEPCRRFHSCERYTVSRACIACVDENAAAWRAANPEQFKANCRSWQENNQERKRVTNAQWLARNADRKRGTNARYHLLNREKEKAASKAWRIANPERAKAATAAWRAANKDRAKQLAAAWAAANPEAGAVKTRNYRARKRTASGSHTASDIADIMRAQSGKCASPWCRAPLKRGKHADHIIALSCGGSNDRRNIQLLCPTCNQRKHAKHPIDFARENGMLL